jgi:hypothetical protein
LARRTRAASSPRPGGSRNLEECACETSMYCDINISDLEHIGLNTPD